MKRKIQVIDADYIIEDKAVAVRCFGKSEDGENVLFRDSGFLPYLYALPAEDSTVDELEQKIQGEEFEHEEEDIPVMDIQSKEMVDGNEEIEVLKVFTSIPPNIPKLKDELWELEEVKECREFDIPFYKRYLIDRGIRPGEWIEIEGEEFQDDNFEVALESDQIKTEVEAADIEWNSLAFDLEVYDDQVVMASFYSEEFKKVLTTEEVDRDYVEKVENEEMLLERLIKIIEDRDIDILTGYNTDEFDFDVLRDRAEEHNLTLSLGRNGERMKFKRRGRFSSARLKGRMHLDLYPFIAHILSPGLESETLDLDSVAEEMLDLNKDDLSWEEMKESWERKENLEEFADYALRDSELAFKLSEEIVPQILELSRLTGLIPFDACRLTYGQLTENFLLREAHEREMIAENRPSRDKREKRRRQGAYSGGFVYTPEPGIYENIALFDFKSLYPTVMVSHNISPDTLNLEECEDRFELEDFDYDFCQDEQGFFPELIEGLVKDRSRVKEEMSNLEKESKRYSELDNRQQAEKILANSVGPETRLVFKDPEGEVRVLSIEEFYELLGRKEKFASGSFYKEVEGWKTLSVEGDEAVFKPVYAASKHDPDGAYRLKTKMGEVTVTGDHSVITMEGDSSNRIRDSEFEELGKVRGSEISKENIVAQVSDVDLGDGRENILVPELLEECEEDFWLYIPKSENLDKREWYQNRVNIMEAALAGMDSKEIQSATGLDRRVIKRAREEGLITKTAVTGSGGNSYECEITEKGEEYLRFYESFKKAEKNSRHYVISLEDVGSLPPKEILDKSFVANKSGRARNKIPAVIELDEELASLLGWFVAEGHVTKKGEEYSYVAMAITSNNSEYRSKISSLFAEIFDYEASVHGNQVCCSTSTISRIFSELCGGAAEEKRVPKQIFNSDREARERFLESYTEGDGDSDGRRLSTISRDLQAGLSLLLKEEDCILHNGYDTGTYRISRRDKTMGEKIVSGDLYGQRPKEIEKTGRPEKVYDISVEDTEKFVTAEGIVLHNSFYGYLGYEGARWYSRESAEATTYLGREYIQDSIETAEEMGYEVVYGDTDSVFLKKDNIRQEMDGFLEKVNEELPEFMELEFEGFFKTGFFTSTDSGEGAKKKYALMDEDGKMKITGFEQVRRDWSPVAKEVQKKVLRKVLEKEVEEAAELVKQKVEELREGDVAVEKLRIYTKLTKKPENYDSTSPHVEAAKKAMKRGKDISPGDNISYVITRGGGSISERAEILEYAEDYDSDYYIENQVIPATLRVLKVFGYTEGQLKGEGRQSGLDRFG